jgi:hypothetical protein
MGCASSPEISVVDSKEKSTTVLRIRSLTSHAFLTQAECSKNVLPVGAVNDDSKTVEMFDCRSTTRDDDDIDIRPSIAERSDHGTKSVRSTRPSNDQVVSVESKRDRHLNLLGDVITHTHEGRVVRSPSCENRGQRIAPWSMW